MEDFTEIRKSVPNVSDEEFKRGIEFSFLISEGKSRVQAYTSAYGESDNLTRDANNILRKKWIKSVIDRLITGNYVLMFPEHIQSLKELFDIGMDKSVSPKVRVDALKYFAELTKKPEAIKIDIDTTIHLGKEMSDKIDSIISKLGNSGGMINSDGSITEAVILD